MKVSRILIAILLVAGVAATASADMGDIYAFNMRSDANELIVFPPDAPAKNVVGGVGMGAIYGLDFNSAATTLYGVTGWAPHTLGTIDLDTAAWTDGPSITGIPDAGLVSGLSVDPTNETFYLSTRNIYNDWILYTLDPATGVATSVGPMTGGVGNEQFIDIAISADGQMYTHDITNNVLYTVDKTSGACTLLGSTGLTSRYAQGMDFDYATNTLYATTYSGSGAGSFVSFDLTDGSANFLYDTSPWNTEMEMAVRSAVPEPATLSLLAFGGLALLRRRG